MRITPFRAAAAAFLMLVPLGCRTRDAAPPSLALERPQIVKDVPTVPLSVLRDTTGSSEVERRTYYVVAPFDTVRAFYRKRLPEAGWAVIGDRGDSNALDLYARKGEQRLWVHLRRVQGAVTEYTLIANLGGSTAPADTAR